MFWRRVINPPTVIEPTPDKGLVQQGAVPAPASPKCMRHCCDCRCHRRGGVSPTLKAFAAKLRAEDGSQPLKPGERRPEGYFIMNHFTGKSDIPTGAVEKIEN